MKKIKNIICLYSSHEDIEQAEDLKAKIKSNIKLAEFEILILLSNQSQKNLYEYYPERGHLFLKVKECYTYLSLKTELMIKACYELFDFEHLFKWDASTLDEKRCLNLQETAGHNLAVLNSFAWASHDYFSHLSAHCDGRNSAKWCRRHKKFVEPILQKEKRDLKCAKHIPEGVDYHKGKFYVLSNKFCEFIVSDDRCSQIFKMNFQHNFGSEDMSIGMCFALNQDLCGIF